MIWYYEEKWFETVAEGIKDDYDSRRCLSKIRRRFFEKDEEIEKLKKEIESLQKKLREETKQELADENENHVLKAHIKECGLQEYVANSLYHSKYGFETLGEVVKFTRKELLGIYGFGGKRIAVLESFLEKNGLKLAEE